MGKVGFGLRQQQQQRAAKSAFSVTKTFGLPSSVTRTSKPAKVKTAVAPQKPPKVIPLGAGVFYPGEKQQQKAARAAFRRSRMMTRDTKLANLAAKPVGSSFGSYVHAAKDVYWGSGLGPGIEAFKHPSELIGEDQKRVRRDERLQATDFSNVAEGVTGYKQIEHPGRDPLGAGLAIAGLLPFGKLGEIAKIARGADAVKGASKLKDLAGDLTEAVKSGHSNRVLNDALAKHPALGDLQGAVKAAKEPNGEAVLHGDLTGAEGKTIDLKAHEQKIPAAKLNERHVFDYAMHHRELLAKDPNLRIALQHGGDGDVSLAISHSAASMPPERVAALKADLEGHVLDLAGKRGALRTPEEAIAHVSDQAQKAAREGFGRLLPDTPLLKPGEVTSETGGAAGLAVREALAGKLDTFGMGAHEAVGAKMDTRSAAAARKEREAGYSTERSQRARAAHLVQQNLSGLDRHLAAKAQMGGKLADGPWRNFQGQVKDNLDQLINHIYDHPNFQPFEKGRASDALLNGIEGRAPTKSEQKLLERAFGRETANGIKASIKQGGFLRTLTDLANVPRSLMASGDLSAPFRQGLVVMASHPQMFFEGFQPMMRAATSEKFFEDEVHAIHSMETYPLMEKAGLSLTDIGDTAKGAQKLSDREEQFMSRIAENLPGVGRVVRGSDRAYVLFLNRTRARLFNVLVQQAAEEGWHLTNDKLVKDIAKFVNSATGRGDLGKLGEHTAALNALFFSPRLLYSRLNFLDPAYYLRMEPFARQQALRAALRLTGAMSTVLFFAKQAGATVVMDPRNADFGKIRIGNTRLDITGGFTQPIRLLAQLSSGQIVSSTSGRLEKLSNSGFGTSRLDVALQFAENKLAPVPSTVVDLLKGSQFGGQPLSAQSELANHMVPLLWQDIAQVYHSTGPKGAIGYGIPDLFGVSVQNYGAPGPKTRKDTSTLEQDAQKYGLGKVPAAVQADVKWKAELDAATYSGQSSFDKAKAAAKLFDQRYGANVEKILPALKTQGQAEALYLELRSKLFPSLEHYQSIIDHAKTVAQDQQQIPGQKNGAPAPAPKPTAKDTSVTPQAPQMQDVSYKVPSTGGQQVAHPNDLTSVAETTLHQLAAGDYNPARTLTKLVTSLASQPLQNTVEVPGGGHIKFQIPKLSGPVGKAARGAIALAEAYLGTPYVWGGESPKGFDCSGLLQYIYAKQGIGIPRTTFDQYKVGTAVPKSQLKPGDAVFFAGSDGSMSNPGHVGIYIGHGKFIEAPHTGATVRISNLAGYPGYVGARRYAKSSRKAA